MATAALIAETVPEQRLTLDGVGWDQYIAVGDALPERANLRMLYARGRLTFSTRSRAQIWFAERLNMILLAIAAGYGLDCEIAGSATFRREDVDAGAEGDKTYYFGPNAERMRGPRDVDLTVDPPPDLVIEVEATYPAEEAMEAWGRLGVPEVWRLDAGRRSLSIWHRRGDATYGRVDRSDFLPMIESDEVVEQLGAAEALGMSVWAAGLMGWVRDVLIPRRR